MKTWLKYVILFLFAVLIGGGVGWLVKDFLGITSTTALNAIRVTWVLGIFIGFAIGRYWNEWKGFWSLRR